MSINSEMTALADSIRTKSGASGSLSISQMKDAVDSITSGGSFEKIIINNPQYLFTYDIPERANDVFKIVEPISMNRMYYFNSEITDIDMTKLDFTPNPNPIDCGYMISKTYKCTSVTLPRGLKVSIASSMLDSSIKLVHVNLKNADFSKCTRFDSLLSNCQSLVEFDGSGMDVNTILCGSFLYNTLALRKIWLPKEWTIANARYNASMFYSNGGTNKMNPNLQVFTDAISEAEQIVNGKWTSATLMYDSSNNKVPDSQMHYGATHEEYEAY